MVILNIAQVAHTDTGTLYQCALSMCTVAEFRIDC